MTLVQRTRDRSYVVLDAPEGYLRGPDGGARVGYESGTTVRAYATEVDARYDLLDEELRSRLTDKWGAGTFVVSGTFGDPLLYTQTGFDSTGYKYSYAFNPAKAAVIPVARLADFNSDKEFFTSWTGALNGWRTYFVPTIQKWFAPGWIEASGERDKIASYDLIQRDWQKLASDRGIKTTVPPKPPVVDENGNPLDSFSGLMKNITWVIGLGFVFYIFTMFIAPPLLSGAARTKEGYRGLRG
jgi:hypothetical protein